MAWIFFFSVFILTATSSFGQNYSSYRREEEDFIPQVPAECEELGICENVPNYPHEHVKKLLAQMKNTDFLFNVNNSNLALLEDTRRDGLLEGEELCRTVTKTVFPSAGKVNHKWVYVINGHEEKIQGFKAKVCKPLGKETKGSTIPCSDLAIVPPIYTAKCQQKFMTVNAWTLTTRGGNVENTVLRIPSCCTCDVFPF